MKMIDSFPKNDMAIIMTGYKDFNILIKNLRHLSIGFDIYLHIDKKSNIPSELLNYINKCGNILLLQKYVVNWGSINHLKAIVDLLELAAKKTRYSRYIIMSENEASLYTIPTIKEFFYNNEKRNYLEIIEPGVHSNTLERVSRLYFLHRYNKRDRSLFGRINTKCWHIIESVFFQLHIYPHYRYSYAYKGYVYCALSQEAIDYIISRNNAATQEMIKEMKYLYVPEEYFFQNILSMDETLRETIINDALIYDDWSNPDQGLPKVLADEDINNVTSSKKLFMRKISGNEGVLQDLLYTVSDYQC